MRYWKALVLGSACVAASTASMAEDWPYLLGQDSNGIVASAKVRTNWNLEKPKQVWRADLGTGCSSITIVDGKAYTMGNADGKDTVWCLEPKTGKTIWTHSYTEDLSPQNYAGGPSVTPTVDGDRVYTVSKTGYLLCLDRHTGKVLWERHYQEDFSGRKAMFGWSASPVISGELLLIDPGSSEGAIVALDKKSGEVRWKAGDSKPGYSIAEFYSYRGKNALAVFHAKDLIGYDLDNEGEVLFTFPWRTSYGINASKPHFFDGKFFVSSGYGSGYAVVDISKDKPEILHRNRELPLQFQNSMMIGNRIMAVFGDNGKESEFLCMDANTGAVIWRQPMPGRRGSLLKLGDYILVAAESGKIFIGKVDDSGFHEISSAEVLGDITWAYPTFVDGFLYLRNNLGETICLDISE